jgi:hypothetical protein
MVVLGFWIVDGCFHTRKIWHEVEQGTKWEENNTQSFFVGHADKRFFPF